MAKVLQKDEPRGGATSEFSKHALREDAPKPWGLGSLMGHSSVLMLNDRIKRMQADGHDIANCTIGDLGGENIATPNAMVQGTIAALLEGKTQYTPIKGVKELRAAIARQVAEEEGVAYDPESEILTSPGGRTPIFLALWSLCKKNESVILPTPAFVAYEQLINLCQIGCRRVDTKQSGYKLTPEALETAIEDAEKEGRPAKMLILNTPGNPTGVVYSRQEMKPLMEIALENGVIVMFDQMYKKFIFNGQKHFNVASFNEAAKSWTVVIDGISKMYVATGLRLGYALAHKDVITEMTKVQGMTVGHATSVVQWGAIEAFTGATEGDEKDIYTELKHRRECVLEWLERLKHQFGVEHAPLDGGFYAWLNFPLIGKTYVNEKGNKTTIRGSTDIADFFLSKAGVGVVPGMEFSCNEEDGAVRLSYGLAGVAHLNVAFERIEGALRKIC